MNDPGKNDPGRDFLAILAGAVAAVAAAFILLPLVYLVFNEFFELHFGDRPPEAWKNELIILITGVLWFFISSVTGGFVCSIISYKNEYRHIWFIIVIGLLIFVLYTQEEFRSRDLPVILWLIAGFIGGALTGGYKGIQFKRKRRDKKEALIR